MAKLTEEQVRQYTQAHIARALAAIQRAQDELGNACQALSPLMHGATTYRKAQNLYDAVHGFWYVVDGLRHNTKVRLDRVNIEAIEERLERQAAEKDAKGEGP